jgi:hypothetical protein
MPFAITCPSCSAKLKTASAIPIGRSVQCPKCKTSFAVSKDNMEEVADTKTAPAAAAAARPAAGAKPAAAAKPAPPASAARKTRGDEDDEDEAPRARKRDEDDDETPRARKKGRDEEDDETPRARKRGDEDDDAPRSRKRGRDEDDEDEKPRKKGRGDDDENERPRARKKGDEDEDDDRPKKRGKGDDEDDDRPRARKKARGEDDDDDDRPRRRGRDDDEDDDDRPRRGKKGKKKGGSGKKYLLIGGGVLVVGLVVFLLIYFLGGGSYDEEMIAFLPADTTNINSIDIADMISAMPPKQRDRMKENFGKSGDTKELKEAGIGPDDIKRVVEAHTKESGSVTVVRLNKGVDKGKLTSGASEQKESGKSYYKMKDGKFVYFASEKLIVEADKEDTMKSILKRDEGKVVLSDTMQEIAKKAAKGTTWHASASDKGAFGFGGVGGDKGLESIFKNAKGSGGWSKLSSSEVDRGEFIMCGSADDAAKLSEAVEKKIEEDKKNIDARIGDLAKFMPNLSEEDKKAIRDNINSRSVSKSGNFVELTQSMKVRDKDDDKGGGPGMMFP